MKKSGLTWTRLIGLTFLPIKKSTTRATTATIKLETPFRDASALFTIEREAY